MSPLEFRTVAGADVPPFIPALARLRIAVFRDWPYLYEGSQASEERYLRIYAESPQAAVVLALDGAEVVGASTCLPLTDETGNVQAPFRAAGIVIDRVFYFGESVLLSPYRGVGAGVRFFTEREAHARRVWLDPPMTCRSMASGAAAASHLIRRSPARCAGRRSVLWRKPRIALPSG
jgi:hypothetical protein